MAGIIANVKSVSTALTASTLKTVLQVTAATNHRIKILGWSVFFDEEVGDITPANPILVTVGRQTGGTASAATPQPVNIYAETLQTTAKDTFTVAATTTILSSRKVNSQTGYEIIYPMGQEIIIAGGGLFGIDVTPGSTISNGGLNVIANILFEE